MEQDQERERGNSWNDATSHKEEIVSADIEEMWSKVALLDQSGWK